MPHMVLLLLTCTCTLPLVCVRTSGVFGGGDGVGGGAGFRVSLKFFFAPKIVALSPPLLKSPTQKTPPRPPKAIKDANDEADENADEDTGEDVDTATDQYEAETHESGQQTLVLGGQPRALRPLRTTRSG